MRRSWDALDGQIDTKSRRSARTVPIDNTLLALLVLYLDRHDGREFAFPGYGRWGREYDPFSADALLKRSRKSWRAAGLTQWACTRQGTPSRA